MRLPLPLQALQRLSGQRLNLQPQVSKWPNRLALLLLLPVLLPACAPLGGHPRDPASAGSGGWSGSEASAYRAGHSDGSHDKRQGRVHAPRPGKREQSSRSEYLRGYGDGFRHPNDNPWSQRRAHELGMQQGQRDKLAGLSMDPERRLAKEVPQAVREHFRSGYREGWRGTKTGAPAQ
jgi:hypothetical protein